VNLKKNENFAAKQKKYFLFSISFVLLRVHSRKRKKREEHLLLVFNQANSNKTTKSYDEF